MKVFSLQAPIYRGAWLSSRLTAQTSQLAAVRRDALERWRRARSRGLSAEEAARAVGASRASLYRWEKRLEPRSRRPHRQRQPTWTSALMRKIERLRADHPMWGKRKLVLLRREGIDVSVSMVGRILTKLMARGVVTPVPMLRRKPGSKTARPAASCKARYSSQPERRSGLPVATIPGQRPGDDGISRSRGDDGRALGFPARHGRRSVIGAVAATGALARGRRCLSPRRGSLRNPARSPGSRLC